MIPGSFESSSRRKITTEEAPRSKNLDLDFKYIADSDVSAVLGFSG